jgi:NADPH:quinone reductase-like Zn-dependent oxidoreductase
LWSLAILVEVRAVAVNPVDYKVASGTVPEVGGIKVVGYDAAGVVVEAGRETRLFKPGDEVFYAGSIGRQGRTRNIISSTSGSWAGSRARSISPPSPLYR